MIKQNQYVPVLKWRLGEYQALMRLDEELKPKIVPLIVIPPIEYDFDEEQPKKNIDEHLSKFGKRVKDKWGGRLSLIDMHSSLVGEVMSTGELSIQYVMRTLEENSCDYIPVLSLDKDENYLEAIKNNLKNTKGLALRLTLTDIADSNINNWLNGIFKRLGIDNSRVDLVVDLVRPDTFMPYSGFGKLVGHYINNISEIDKYRSLVLVATSLNLKEIKRPGGEFDRHEWIFFKSFINDMGEQLSPAFGDYVIETPEFQEVDFRLMNPAGKLIYTCVESWLVSKGRSFRDDASQMVEHCKKVRDSIHFDGPQFSWGDDKICKMADHSSSNYGNLGTWKQVGVSHHLTKVVHQVSSFFLFLKLLFIHSSVSLYVVILDIC